jgi:hypothetical protein
VDQSFIARSCRELLDGAGATNDFPHLPKRVRKVPLRRSSRPEPQQGTDDVRETALIGRHCRFDPCGRAQPRSPFVSENPHGVEISFPACEAIHDDIGVLARTLPKVPTVCFLLAVRMNQLFTKVDAQHAG